MLVIGVSSNGNIGTYTAKQNILQLNNAAEVKTQLNIGNDSISLFMMQGEIVSNTDSVVIIGGTYQWISGTFPNDTLNSRIKLDWYNKYTNVIVRSKQYSSYQNKNDATMFCITKFNNRILVCGTNIASYN